MNAGTLRRAVLSAVFAAAGFAALGCQHTEDGQANNAAQSGPCNRRESSFSSCHDQVAQKGNESGNIASARPPTQRELALVKERVPESRATSMLPPPVRTQLPPPLPPPRRPPLKAPAF